jgi:hypothetical protein
MVIKLLPHYAFIIKDMYDLKGLHFFLDIQDKNTTNQKPKYPHEKSLDFGDNILYLSLESYKEKSRTKKSEKGDIKQLHTHLPSQKKRQKEK